MVDYRELNRTTVRKFFIIPNSDGIKATVAGSKYISVGDLKEGFNQVDNEPETSKKMAVLSVTGSYLPRGLTFGPVNGPEDFQGLVFEIFARRLYNDHFIFIDDLAVATGRPKCWPEGASGVADTLNSLRVQGRSGDLKQNPTVCMVEEEIPQGTAFNTVSYTHLTLPTILLV